MAMSLALSVMVASLGFGAPLLTSPVSASRRSLWRGPRTPPPFPGGECLMLYYLDHILGCGCRGFGLLHQLIRHGIELGRLRALGPGQRDGQSAVAALADGGNQLDGTQEGNAELLGGSLGATTGEDVDLLVAVRAGEVAHVLHDAQHLDVDLRKHLQRL